MRVLIIETNLQTAQIISRFFEDRRDEVWHVWKLEEASALLDLVQPDLMVMDLHIPGDQWVDFLRHTRLLFPHLKIIMTNKHPDLERELLAKQHGVKVFVRQPFTRRWMEHALHNVENLFSPMSTQGLDTKNVPTASLPLRWKLTIPFIILFIFLLLLGIFITNQALKETVENRFYMQIGKMGLQASRWMERQEEQLVSSVRLLSNLEGLEVGMERQDADMIRKLTLPYMYYLHAERVEFLDRDGNGLLSVMARPGEEPQQYDFSRGDVSFRNIGLINNALKGAVDRQGDKYAGLVSTPLGEYFYACGPVYNSNREVIGVVLVGRSVSGLAHQMADENVGFYSLYDMNGNILSSTLDGGTNQVMLNSDQTQTIISNQQSGNLIRKIKLGDQQYSELLGIWNVRGGKTLGLYGVALNQTAQQDASMQIRLQLTALIVLGIISVLFVGLFLTSQVVQPLKRLSLVANEVGIGNHGIRLEVDGEDEITILEHAFNTMVVGIQEGEIYRELVGRSVRPEMAGALRRNLSSGALQLEGQSAEATVLMIDIRGFTAMTEHQSPAQVFEWLNEYFDTLLPIISAHEGVINKFEGDGMLFFFGVIPRMLTKQQCAYEAAKAAVEIMSAIEGINQRREQRGDPPFLSGIGIDTGTVMAGGLGTRERRYFTILGDTVNTAQRLERISRQMPAFNGILVSEDTRNALGDHQSDFIFKLLGDYPILAKSQMKKVFFMTARSFPENGIKDELEI